MAKIVIYNPSDTTVPYKVTAYHPSAHTPSFDAESNKLVNPSLSAVSGVDQRYWKVTGSPLTVDEMSNSEKAAIDALVVNKRSIHNLLTFEKSTRKSSWTRLETFVYEGSTEMGVPYEIEAIGYVDSGATGSLRIFDKTNGVVLGTANITNTAEDTIEVSTDGDWPGSSALIEIHVKRTSGTARKKVYLNGMIIGF